MRRLLLVILLTTCLVEGCGKKAPPIDRSSPEATVHSLVKAINGGRFPGEIRQFFIDDVEVDSWTMRCTTRGCASAEMKSLTVERAENYRADLRATYVIRSPEGGAVMRGTDSPITLIREGKRWYIKQWGQRRTVDTPAAPPNADAGAAP